MHLVSRLRRTLATTIVLLGMLAGLGVASAQADAPIHTGGGGRQTPRVAEQTPGTLPSNTTSTPLTTPSPIQTTTPLNPTPDTPSSTTGSPDNTGSTPAQSADKTDDQASHTVRFDPADGSKPTQSIVKTGTLATPPQQNPAREGFRFDGWAHNNQPFNFQVPILQDMTLTAKWTKVMDWTLNPDHGPASGARLTINPPSPQEPYYVNLQAAGEQLVGLTGDGRIYTWTQDNTPIQVPFPAQAPNGFHYLQATAGSHWHAALRSDQQIYTWTSGQSTPTILDTSQNTQFASISINDDRLMAVDRQGQVHAFQASQKDSQNKDPKPDGQETTSLPRKAQAVTAVASATRILALDSDGQAWTWDAGMTAQAKPARVKQDPGTRLIQAQPLSTGFLLLDSKGQARYLADSTTSPIAAGLPDGVQASRLTTGNDQAVITDTDGHVWAWKPDKTPIRADNRKQAYVQAAAAGSRITAIDRQGNIFTWSLDPQSNPGKPARLDTTAAPTLETASMDGQPLKLSKTGEAWQVDMPARKPGQATITITGRQDGQPFTRSLSYTVDQTLTRDNEQSATHTATFDTAGGSPKFPDQPVSYPYGRIQRPSPDPTREGYQFDGWFIGQVAYDFSKPVTKDLTLTAKWTRLDSNNTWKISPDKGSQLGRESTTITPPDSANRGIRFNQISGAKNDFSSTYGFSLAVGSDGNAYAWGDNQYGQLGDGTKTSRTTPVMVKKPDRNTYPDLPEDFTYMQVSAGSQHSLALGSDGYAYAWGRNSYGQLGNNTSSNSYVPVRVRDPANPTDTGKGLHAVQVSAGNYHSLALGSDGNAYAWGWNSSGQLGNNTTSGRYGSNPVPVHVRDPANPTDTSKGLQAVQVSAGYSHSLAVGSDGYAYAWGANLWGRLGNNTSNMKVSPLPEHVRDPANPTDTSKGLQATQVSAGGDHSLALDSDGNAYAWGYNSYYGELGDGTTSQRTTPVRVRTPDRNTYPDLPADFTYVQVSAGTSHSLALGSDGNAYAWGYNDYGQLGNNSNSYTNPVPIRVRNPASPTDTSKGLQATRVSAGGNHSLALGSDGTAYAWGYNNSGQLGDNTTDNKSAPVPVMFNLQQVITGVRFDQTAVSGLTRGDGGSVSVTTPAHQPGTVTVSVDYTLGGAPQTPDTSLRYTYLPAGVLPKAGGEGILLALATGMTGMGGVLASRRHRKETHQLLHASHE